MIHGILLLTVIQAAHGQQPSKEASVTSQLRLLGFTLGSSTLADVQNELGPARAGACSKEEESSKVICYVSDGPDKTRILFEAGFSGGWSRLDGVRVSSGKLAPTCLIQCTAMAETAVHTDGGLRLGLTRQELIKLLGLPAQANGNSLTFEWLSKRPMTKAEIDRETRTFKAPVTDPYWDVQDTVEVTMNDSKVAEFHIKHIVTY